MPKITITDIDGTIIEQGQPVENVLDYIDELGDDVIVLTNRPESDRDKTIQDLANADLDYTRLIMNGGSAPAPEFKKAEVKKLLDEGFDPQVFIDNDKANRDAVGSLGVKTLDPADIPQSSNEMPEDMPMDNMDAVAKLTKFMTIEEQLIKASADLISASAERDELRANLENAVAKEASDFKATLEQNASLVIERDALAKEKAELVAKIAELQTQTVSASVEAAKIASSVGVNPVELSPSDKSDEPVKAVNHLEVFLAMEMGAERSAYFAKHKNEIVRAI
jgi:hydroxymethylpyrimidine pyrophosphatase-like HAD family hydrolase